MATLKRSTGDRIYLGVIYLILWFSLIIIVYPLVYIVSSSFSSPLAVISGRVWLWPVEPTLLAYETVFKTNQVLIGYKNSLLYAAVGTFINIIMTIIAAYPLSRKDFFGRQFLMLMFTFTMFFSGGLIPTYLVVRNLGLIDKFWVMIIPGALSVFQVIIARTFFQSSIPEELYESSSLDGCDHFTYLAKIVVPLSKPIIAVLALMYAIGHWNSYFNALIYLNNPKRFPLQIVLRDILIMNSIDTTALDKVNIESAMQKQYLSELLKYALIVVASVPVMIFYPFIQKYFIKGMMIGSIKG